MVEVLSVSVGDGLATPALPSQETVNKPDPQEQESIGVVKRYDATKGFGFIAMENGGNDVFVHATALSRSGLVELEAGQNVLVRYVQGQKGLEARTLSLR